MGASAYELADELLLGENVLEKALPEVLNAHEEVPLEREREALVLLVLEEALALRDDLLRLLASWIREGVD